jgi:antitoxin CptB
MTEIKRLRWLCRRGILELDMLLLPFCEKKFENLSKEKKRKFLEILKFEDNTLYSMLIKNVKCPQQLNDIILDIKEFHLNNTKKNK